MLASQFVLFVMSDEVVRVISAEKLQDKIKASLGEELEIKSVTPLAEESQKRMLSEGVTIVTPAPGEYTGERIMQEKIRLVSRSRSKRPLDADFAADSGTPATNSSSSDMPAVPTSSSGSGGAPVPTTTSDDASALRRGVLRVRSARTFDGVCH